MSKFLIGTMPITGHVIPLLPVARKLVERGHEVWWYAGKKFQAKIETTGARYVPMKVAYDFDDHDLNGAFKGRGDQKGVAQLKWDLKHVFTDAMAKQYEDLAEIMKSFPADALVCDSGFQGGQVLNHKGGPPWAGISITAFTGTSRDTAPFGLALMPSSSPPGRLRNRMLNWLITSVLFRDVAKYAQNTRDALGLPRVKSNIFDMSLSPYLHIQGTSQAFEYPRSDLLPQVHFVGPILPEPPAHFNPPAWWDEMVNSKRPVVHVTQGTAATNSEELLVPTLKALANEDVLVVATTGGKPVESVKLDSLPANVRLESFIPHYHLLPHVDVMITNGGYGAVQQALLNGIPLVAGGTTEEKPEICTRIAWSGAGINLKTATPTPDKILKAVKQVLTDPKYKENAKRIQADFARHDALTETAELLEELVRTGQPILSTGRALSKSIS